MGNKQILAQNNETLASILSNVLGLPSQESLKHGAYVWKKYEYTPAVTVENPSITVTHGGSIVTFPITDANFDLTKVSDYERFFDGFIGGTTYPNIGYETSTSKLYFKENSAFQPTIDSFVADSETTGRFVVSSTTSVTPTSTTFSYSGTKELCEASIGAFLDFVVSDSPTAYPDRGEQDGYWYEKVKDGITPEMFGCTKMAIDTFTFASATYCTMEVSHSLGEIPKVLLIMTSGELSLNNELKYSFSCLTGTYTEVNTSDAFYSTSNRAITLANSTITLTSTTFKKQNRNYSAGKEYIVITMA